MLLSFMSGHLKSHFSDYRALVIPTDSARRSLHAVGWKTKGQIVPHVFLVDPTARFQAVLRNEWVAAALGRGFRSSVSAVLRRHVRTDCDLQCDVAIDESLSTLWHELPRSDRVTRDLSFPSLKWRYVEHPRTRYLAAKLSRDGLVRAFMIFHINSQERSCSVYDVLARTPQDFSCMMASFLMRALERGELATVRISLDDSHPFRGRLRSLGFLARSPIAPYQVRSCSEGTERWTLSSGDKDI
jgi:hypothetical protein